MAVGLLPSRNAELLKFQQWSAAQLDRVQPRQDRQALATYVAWHHHRRLARHLADGTLKPSTCGTARQQVSVAVHFWPGSGIGARRSRAATSTTSTNGSPPASPMPPVRS
jgi:hypothetical protein